MPEPLLGGCLCGALRYRVVLPVTDAGYCHCRSCQRASGAPAVAWLTVPVAQFSYISGRPAVHFSSAAGQREFCGGCGTPIGLRRRLGATTVDVTLASLDDPDAVEPEYHVWTASRVHWFDTADDLPRFADSGPDPDPL